MYKHILIPLENSETDQTIINHVKPLAKTMGSKITFVHVADGFVARNIENLNLAESEEMRADAAYLKKCSEELSREGLTVESKLLCGEPAIEINKISAEMKCDLIAMATHGHGFVKDLILGSVAEELRHRTDIPILMIRAPKAKSNEK